MTYRALIVDDESCVRDVVSMVLKRSGFDVVEAEDGLEALEALEQAETPFDLIHTDQNMPRMKGLEFLAHEKVQKYDAVKVFCASVKNEVYDQARALGAVVFEKPINDLFAYANKAKQLIEER